MGLASNLNVIYLVLIGLTDLFMKNVQLQEQDDDAYYCLENSEESIS